MSPAPMADGNGAAFAERLNGEKPPLGAIAGGQPLDACLARRGFDGRLAIGVGQSRRLARLTAFEARGEVRPSA